MEFTQGLIWITSLGLILALSTNFYDIFLKN